MNKILLILILGMLFLSIVLVSANNNHQNEIEEGKNLVESKINCDKLNNEQLEVIGEYLMEQMHPGEQHEAMHEMMGMEEGTEYHKQFHVNIAKTLYCGESSGMMGSGGMMGMMNMMNWQTPQTNMMQGMMGNWPYFGYWNFVNVLYVILLIGLVILVYLGIIKLLRDLFKRKLTKTF